MLLQGRSVSKECCGTTVMMDSIVVSIIMENAVSNALKHGDPTGPPIKLTIQDSPNAEDPSRAQVTIRITNKAIPGVPSITPELIEGIINRPEQMPQERLGASTGVGLKHALSIARLTGMDARIFQEGPDVTFELVFDAPIVEAEVVEAAEPVLSPSVSPSHGALSPVIRLNISRPKGRFTFPAGTQIVCIDDSQISVQLLSHQLTRWATSIGIQTYGASAAEVPLFVRDALTRATIAICDQHMDFPQRPHLGTDLVRQLRDSGFQGLLVIRSAGPSQLDTAFFLASGADLVLPKELPGREVVQRLHHAAINFLPVEPSMDGPPINPLLSAPLPGSMQDPTAAPAVTEASSRGMMYAKRDATNRWSTV